MKTATHIALYQLAIALAAALIWGVGSNVGSGLAALAGGGISALLTFYAGVVNFGRVSDDPRQRVMNFYRAEARKLALAVVLFGFAAKFMAAQFAPLIITFAATLTVYWFALLWKDDGR
ncbi:MAG: ATP synthase subunit I [Stagnimonas sp.]|nr:ATP synthase subunit I [Stagnimonas sp.]